MEAKVLHFTVDVEGVVEFARERYWFQDAKKHGVNILKCFIGIEPYQITRILEGDATLKEDPLRDNKIYYFEESDEDFKSKLKDFDAYRKKMSDENFMYIAGTKVQKDLIDEYAGHVVKRLRESMRNTKYGVMFDMKDMDLARQAGREGSARLSLVKDRLKKKLDAKKAGGGKKG